MCEVFLDGCDVRDEDVLGRRGGGMAVFTASMRLERSCILATAVGSMQHQLESSLSYAQSRRQFGQEVGAFQAVANRLVDMHLRVETARLMLYRLARLLDDGRPVDAEAALTKLHISEAYVASSMDAIRVHGGYGYLSEYGVERELRDAIGSTLYSGTSDIQRNIVARALGLSSRPPHGRADGGDR
jgi:alkylation response protein AidB-like acyl-CoA dehydrogenase